MFDPVNKPGLGGEGLSNYKLRFCFFGGCDVAEVGAVLRGLLPQPLTVDVCCGDAVPQCPDVRDSITCLALKLYCYGLVSLTVPRVLRRRHAVRSDTAYITTCFACVDAIGTAPVWPVVSRVLRRCHTVRTVYVLVWPTG